MGTSPARRLIAALSLPLALSSCSMRVPVQDLEFSPEEKIVLTFQDGAKLVGRVDNGEGIRYLNEENIFRGVVESVDETEIVVADLIALEAKGTNRYERARMAHHRLYVDEEQRERLILSRDDVLQVERVVPDKTRTIRRVAFWSFGVGIAMLAVRDRNF